MKKLKVLFITHHWKNNSHHSQYGGYQRLVDYMPDSIESTVLTWGQKNEAYMDGKINVITRKIPSLLTFLSKRIILSKYASKISHEFDLIHSLYDDVAPINSKKPLITTFHTIKDLDKSSLWLKFRFIHQLIIMKKSKKVIVLSNNMKKIFSNYTNPEKIFVIPHGIDTNHFKPVKLPEKLKKLRHGFDNIILCIGNYGTEKEKIIGISKKLKNNLFIVINKDLNLKSQNNLILLKKVSDEELLEYYTLSDFLFRPLKFSSANNSILEAISVGRVVITTKTEGVKDYLNDENSIILKDIKDLNDTSLNRKFDKKIIRKNAKVFDWEKITKEIVSEYESIINNEK